MRLLERAATTVVLATALVLGSGAANANDRQTEPESRWSQRDLPGTDVAIHDFAQPGGGTTWAAGSRWIRDADGRYVRTQASLFAADRGGPWREISIQGSELPNRLNGIDGSSHKSAVAVGDFARAIDGVLTQMWDGTRWHLQVAPMPAGTEHRALLSVAEVAPDNRWAVGLAHVLVEGGPPEKTHKRVPVVRHWNGTAWREVALPMPDGVLSAISAVSARDIRAVGQSGSGQAVMLHFDGSSWKHVPLPPNTGADGMLDSIVTRGADDVWVGGRSYTPEVTKALLYHYDGVAWTEQPAPEGTKFFGDIALTRDGIAVTTYSNDANRILRLIGGRWIQLALPAGTPPSPAWRTSILFTDRHTLTVSATRDLDPDIRATLTTRL